MLFFQSSLPAIFGSRNCFDEFNGKIKIGQPGNHPFPGLKTKTLAALGQQ